MNWLTKELTLDLLAITISSLVRCHDAISGNTEAEDPWKPSAPETPNTPTEKPEVKQEPQPEAQPETPAANDDDGKPTMPEIQTALRTIAKAEGTDWIQNELFAGFGITNITHLSDDKLPLAWEIITTHQEELEGN